MPILNATVACSRFSVSGHDRKKWPPNGWVLVEKETENPEQAIDAAAVLHCHVVIAHCRNVRGLGMSVVVFRLFEKLRYSNERSTKFEGLKQE